MAFKKLKEERKRRTYQNDLSRGMFRAHNALANADNWELDKYDFFTGDDTSEKVYKAPKGKYPDYDVAKKKVKPYQMQHTLNDAAVESNMGRMHLGVSFVDKYSPDNPYKDKAKHEAVFYNALKASGAEHFA